MALALNQPGTRFVWNARREQGGKRACPGAETEGGWRLSRHVERQLVMVRSGDRHRIATPIQSGRGRREPKRPGSWSTTQTANTKDQCWQADADDWWLSSKWPNQNRQTAASTITASALRVCINTRLIAPNHDPGNDQGSYPMGWFVDRHQKSDQTIINSTTASEACPTQVGRPRHRSANAKVSVPVAPAHEQQPLRHAPAAKVDQCKRGPS